MPVAGFSFAGAGGSAVAGDGGAEVVHCLPPHAHQWCLLGDRRRSERHVPWMSRERVADSVQHRRMAAPATAEDNDAGIGQRDSGG